MLGTSDHNIEVGGCGGKQGISVVSCGWPFFLKNPVAGGYIPVVPHKAVVEVSKIGNL